MLEKKLNQKKFLTDDFNKLLVATETERCRNEIPGAYVSFNSTINKKYIKFKYAFKFVGMQIQI